MHYQEVISFHGHECPGLAIGYRMSLAAMKALDEIRGFTQHRRRHGPRDDF